MKTLDPTEATEQAERVAALDDLSGGMSIWECMRVALRGLVANKMRTMLTMLGIIIGVAAVIAMVSMGQGASQSVTKQINQLGTNLLMVFPGNPRLRFGENSAPSMRLEDAKTIEARFKNSVKAVAPQSRGSAQVTMGDKNANTQVTGTTPAYESVNNEPLRAGRYFTEGEVNGRAKVALVGDTVLENLLGDRNAAPLGQTILINKVPFTIIGILADKGSGSFGQDQDDTVLIPITTALRRVFNRTYINSISVEATSPKMMDLATEQITDLLRQRHHLLPPFPDNDDFAVRNQTSLLQTSQGVTGALTGLLAGVAIVSLIVGGIGIMNIMLVSVTERTREIGLRKAVGATSQDILVQFLIESLVMALIGGLIGIVLGVGVSAFMSSKMGWSTVVQPSIVIVAAAVSGGIGIVFGVYPAAKAASQNPIEALRYEQASAAGLVNELLEAQHDNQLSRALLRWSRYDLICIDELGYVPLVELGTELLFQVISERAERASVMITTNLPFSEWTQVFTNARLCKALLDRLTDRAHIIETGGESYRFRRTLDRRRDRHPTERPEGSEYSSGSEPPDSPDPAGPDELPADEP